MVGTILPGTFAESLRQDLPPRIAVSLENLVTLVLKFEVLQSMLALQFGILLIEFLVCLAEGLTDIALSLLKHLLLTVDLNLVFSFSV